MLYLYLVNNKVLRWEGSIACLSLFLIAFLVFSAALLRLVGLPQAWMSDLSQLLFGWVIFLGSDLALSYKRHIGVEFFEERLPDRLRSYISDLWSVIIISFLGFVSYYGWFLAQRSRREFDSLMISETNLAVFLAVLAVSMVILDFVHSGKKHVKAYVAALVVVLMVSLFLFNNMELSSQPEPLSYAFLIVSVPVGCLLMIRTECLHIIKRRSKSND